MKKSFLNFAAVAALVAVSFVSCEKTANAAADTVEAGADAVVEGADAVVEGAGDVVEAADSTVAEVITVEGDSVVADSIAQ